MNEAITSLFDNYRERLILGTLLLKPERWPETDGLSIEDFGLTAHKEIYATMARLAEDGKAPGFDDVCAELQDSADVVACLSDLMDAVESGAADLKKAVSKLQELRRKRTFARCMEDVQKWYQVSTTGQLTTYVTDVLRGLEDLGPTKCGLIVDTLASVRARPQGYLWE